MTSQLLLSSMSIILIAFQWSFPAAYENLKLITEVVMNNRQAGKIISVENTKQFTVGSARRPRLKSWIIFIEQRIASVSRWYSSGANRESSSRLKKSFSLWSRIFFPRYKRCEVLYHIQIYICTLCIHIYTRRIPLKRQPEFIDVGASESLRSSIPLLWPTHIFRRPMLSLAPRRARSLFVSFECTISEIPLLVRYDRGKTAHQFSQ